MGFNTGVSHGAGERINIFVCDQKLVCRLPNRSNFE